MATDHLPRARAGPTRAEIQRDVALLKLAGAGPYAIAAYLRQQYPCASFTVVAEKHVLWLAPDPDLPAVVVG